MSARRQDLRVLVEFHEWWETHYPVCRRLWQRLGAVNGEA